MFIVKVHRQHTSLVVVIPKGVRDTLGLITGDYVVLSDHTQESKYPLFYLEKWRQPDGRDSSNPDKENSARGVRAQDGGGG